MIQCEICYDEVPVGTPGWRVWSPEHTELWNEPVHFDTEWICPECGQKDGYEDLSPRYTLWRDYGQRVAESGKVG